MRKKRSISTEVVHSAAMRALPAGAVVVYMDLCLAADDDGFVHDPIGTARASGGSAAELELLRGAGFVLVFENCALVRHWFRQNPKNKWRHTPTVFTQELAQVELDADGNWTLKPGVTPVCAKTVSQQEAKVSSQVSSEGISPVIAEVTSEVISPKRTEPAAPIAERSCETDCEAGEADVLSHCTSQVKAEVISPRTADVISPVTSDVTAEVISNAPSRAYMDNNNNNNKNNFSYRYSDHSESGFKPPTVDEVRAYCEAEGLGGVDAQYFTDYYAAKGWRIGSSPMADWRAVARNWQLKSKERKRDAPPEKPPLRPLYKVLN